MFECLNDPPFSDCDDELICGECSATCGKDAVKMCSREIMQRTSNGGMECLIVNSIQPCGLEDCTNPNMGVRIMCICSNQISGIMDM